MFLNKIELEKAIDISLETINSNKEIEKINLRNGIGRVLGEDYYANINNPPFDRSPLDGYALRSIDTENISKENPKVFREIDTIYAGDVSLKELNEFECIRIMTGAKMPKGSDTVIRLEDVEVNNRDIKISQKLNRHDNYVFEGEDIKKGDLLIKKGTKLNFIHLGVLGSMGEGEIKVYKKPKIAILGTGDELISYRKPLEEGKIYDTNGTMIGGRLEELGFEYKIIETTKDDVKLVSDLILKNIDEFDMFITTGGVSVGDKDIIHDVIDEIGGVKKFWRVNIRPGTPMMYSLVKDKPILSLSGNPFAALTNFELVGRPILSKLSGDKSIETKRVKGIMKTSFPKSSMKVRRIIRCYYEDGKVFLPEEGHSSGKMLKMIGCNGLIDMKIGRENLKIGDEVEVLLL